MFLASVGFWNFLGAGVFGFLINLPIVSYYEIGTALTSNHGHTAFMGVYGMLAIGLALFCQRYFVPSARWSDRAARFSFWALNLGLAWMSFATLLPLGILQLYHAVSSGYFEARSLEFLSTETASALEWMRLPGDALFIAGILPLLYVSWISIRHMAAPVTMEEPKDLLFTEVTEEVGAQS
jgi:nitric oxide reductase subunit B